MHRKLGLLVLFLLAAAVLAGFRARPKDEVGRLRDAFADLRLDAHLSDGSAEGSLYRDHRRFEDVANRLERTVRGRPGWYAGKVDRWQESYSANYFPERAYPWWLRWIRLRFAPGSSRHINVAVLRGYLKKGWTGTSPPGHWVSLTVVSSPASTPGPFTPLFQGWYPDTSSGW
jgi:hypothetical protein